jgi:hypothetical protein
MKSLYSLLTLLFLACHVVPSFGQSLENDTIFIKRYVHTEELEIDTLIIENGISPAQTKVLVGTMFIPMSDKMIGLLNNGLSPIRLELIQGCDNTVDPRTFADHPLFQKVERDSTTLTVEVSVIANCRHDFLGEAEVIGNDTLNLIYTSYGGFCSCQCCFTLNYAFDTTMEEDNQVLRYVTINRSKKVGLVPVRK